MTTSEEQNPEGDREAARAEATRVESATTDAGPADVTDAKPAESTDAKAAEATDAKPAGSTDAKPAESTDAKAADAKPAESTAARPWWRRMRWGELLLLVVALAVVGRFAVRHRAGLLDRGDNRGGRADSFRPSEFARPVSDDVQAFLAPIAVGSEVGGATVTKISPVVDGKIHVELRKGSETVRIAIARARGSSTEQGHGRYVVYIWEREPSSTANMVAYAFSTTLGTYANHRAPAGLAFGEH